MGGNLVLHQLVNILASSKGAAKWNYWSGIWDLGMGHSVYVYIPDNIAESLSTEPKERKQIKIGNIHMNNMSDRHRI